MTVSTLYQHITEQLQKAGCDSPAFDACCLLEDLAHCPHGRDLSLDETELSPALTDAVRAAASRRASGEPLQYILGNWDFLSLTLAVGEGVLIPRPDTELLCEVAAQHLAATPSPSVLDLCAGSGCVGLGVASLVNGATVTAVELSDAALGYLRRNVARYPQYHVAVMQDDVCVPKGDYGLYDAIVSNPPYIPTADLAGLMREVQFEPTMALDGDADGLRFYRVMASLWSKHLKAGGLLAVEVGIGQAADVAALFEQAGLVDVAVHRDLGGIERVVCAKRPENDKIS